MLFNFELFPLDSVVTSDRMEEGLDWSGLTTGWYWIDAGGSELYRYSEAMCSHSATVHSEPRHPYDECRLVRPWEDLLQRLPAFLTPIPEEFATRVESSDSWNARVEQAARWADDSDDQVDQGDRQDTWERFDLSEKALSWWWDRTWDAHHLSHPPRIWIWTVGETTRLRWDNRESMFEGHPVWDAQTGEVSMPAGEFIAEVNSFHGRFLAEMQERVAAVKRNWTGSDVHTDVDSLDREQQERSGRLAAALGRNERVDWFRVRRALDRLDAELDRLPM
ncbi:MAG: DUF5984 family protein [Capsulimonadaceae bacterium]